MNLFILSLYHTFACMYQEKYNRAKKEYLISDLTIRQICKKYKCDRFKFSNNLKSEGISTRRKIDSDDTIFENIDSEEKAYWLGFLFADGCVSYSLKRKSYNLELSLAEKDLNHIEKFKLFMKSNRKIVFREKTKSYRFIIGSKKICGDLIKLGCTNKKSLTLKFPISLISKTLYFPFIRGYFDGNGSISHCNYTTPNLTIIGTLEFLSEIKNIFNFKDNSIKKDKRHLNNTFYIKPNVSETMNFLNIIYNNSNIFLERKKEIYKKIFNCRVGKKLSI